LYQCAGVGNGTALIGIDGQKIALVRKIFLPDKVVAAGCQS
jgi:hypothetical protein